MKLKQLRKALMLIFVLGMVLFTYPDANSEPIDDEHGRQEFVGMVSAGKVLLPAIIKTANSKIEGICFQLVAFGDPISHLGGMFADHHLPDGHFAAPKLKKLAETTVSIMLKYCNIKSMSDNKVDWPALKAGLNDLKIQMDAISEMKIFASPR